MEQVPTWATTPTGISGRSSIPACAIGSHPPLEIGRTLTLASTAFYNVIVNKVAGSSVTLGGVMIATANFALISGTVTTGAGNYLIAVGSCVSIQGGTLMLNASSMTVMRSWDLTGG